MIGTVVAIPNCSEILLGRLAILEHRRTGNVRDVFVWRSGPEIIEGTADLRRDLFIYGGDRLLQRVALASGRWLSWPLRRLPDPAQILLDPFRVPVWPPIVMSRVNAETPPFKILHNS